MMKGKHWGFWYLTMREWRSGITCDDQMSPIDSKGMGGTMEVEAEVMGQRTCSGS